jgi:hypothetical protein
MYRARDTVLMQMRTARTYAPVAVALRAKLSLDFALPGLYTLQLRQSCLAFILIHDEMGARRGILHPDWRC